MSETSYVKKRQVYSLTVSTLQTNNKSLCQFSRKQQNRYLVKSQLDFLSNIIICAF